MAVCHALAIEREIEQSKETNGIHPYILQCYVWRTNEYAIECLPATSLHIN